MSAHEINDLFESEVLVARLYVRLKELVHFGVNNCKAVVQN